ncbi:FixH family protein [Bacillus oleivorans]|uniref:FixH family protein n=1 Tax=Bacillus oleivorans TaxID=1448271 RepID=UPI0015CAC1DB|nr:FixH family protein [Bacillus oleivorans]
MRKLLIILFMMIVLILAGCGKEDSAPNGNTEQGLEMVEVDLIVPEQTNPGEELTIEAKVTQGEEAVDDADSVKFEIWNTEDEENSVMIPFESKSGGTYGITYTFPTDGVYVVQVHVDARNLHVMPSNEVIVGKGSAAKHSHSEDDHHETTESHDHHHADSDITMNFNQSTFTLNQKSELKVQLSKQGNPYTDARVRFEVWLDGAASHDWIDASETGPGEYAAAHEFESAGTYFIVIHVEHEDGTHIHSEETITVE